jgi:hypothetical protein
MSGLNLLICLGVAKRTVPLPRSLQTLFDGDAILGTGATSAGYSEPTRFQAISSSRLRACRNKATSSNAPPISSSGFPRPSWMRTLAARPVTTLDRSRRRAIGSIAPRFHPDAASTRSDLTSDLAHPVPLAHRMGEGSRVRADSGEGRGAGVRCYALVQSSRFKVQLTAP